MTLDRIISTLIMFEGMWLMKDKKTNRDYERFHLSFYLRVFEGESFRGFLIDLSEGGLKIMSETPLQVDRRYIMRMKLPSRFHTRQDVAGDEYLEFAAMCKWHQPDESAPEFSINGLEFINMARGLQVQVSRLIREFRA